MSQPTRKIVIDLSKYTFRCLVGFNGCRCPIGTYLSALGVPDKEMLNEAGPAALRLRGVLPAEAYWLACEPAFASRDCDVIISNAAAIRHERSRKEITAAFARHGVEVEYAGLEDT